jgi:amiloride-sensitive sodium channel
MLEVLEENKMNFFTFLNWKEMTNPRKLRILTDDGLCYTFNAIDANLIFRNDTVDPKFIEKYQSNQKKEGNDPILWSMEEGYQPGVSNYPYKAFDSNANSLKFKLALSKKWLKVLRTFCNKNSKSFKLIFNHPAEIPRVSSNRLLIPFNRSLDILITPKITKTSDSLKSYDPSVQK